MSSTEEARLVPEVPLSSSIVEESCQNLLMPEAKSDKAGSSINTIHESFFFTEGSGTELLEHRQIALSNEADTLAIKEKTEIGAGLSNTESSSAVTVQKLYRSYRTRRHLADCAVMVKKFGWWNVLEGALLQQNSEYFYAFEKHDTAAARWLRLRKKASRVGKGLLKDENARKLTIQHWLEAIDARHRYGHNLHFYYDVWQRSQTREPFFYWLDVGEGRDLELLECSRSKLLKEQIKYLSPKEREHFEVTVVDGKLIYKKSGELVNTPKGDKWIFVMSTSGKMYIAKKERGIFQHSSFLAGGATTAAGCLLVKDGVLELMEAHSGHYHPTEDNFKELVNILTKLGADLTMAKVNYHSGNRVLESVGVVTEQSHIISCDVHGIEEVGKFIAVNHISNKVDSKLKDSGTGQDCLDSCLNENATNDEQQLPTLEGLHIEVLGQFPTSNGPGDMLKEGESVCDNTAIAESQEKCILSSQALKEKVEMAFIQETQDKNVRLHRWSTGAGPRISSLSEVPREILDKVWQGIDRSQLAVTTSEG